jgi:hypothetical protein
MINRFGQGGCVFYSSPKRLQWPHPQLVHWWLLVQSSRSLGIAGHQMRNREWNFTKRNNWDPNWLFFTNFGGKLSFIPSFLSAFTPTIYTFTAHTCTTIIVTLEPCALNVEFEDFIERFNKISLFWGYH